MPTKKNYLYGIILFFATPAKKAPVYTCRQEWKICPIFILRAAKKMPAANLAKTCEVQNSIGRYEARLYFKIIIH